MIYKKLTIFQKNIGGFSSYIQIIVNRKGLVCGNSSIGISDQKENWKRHYVTHKENERIRVQKWRAENPNNVKQYQEKYRHNDIERRREQSRRSKRKTYPQRKTQELTRNAFRRNKMGFNPLNNSIEGIKCDAHHIDMENVIYIPTVIHNAIFHILKINKNMGLINSIAEGFR
ncbi:MAG: hypothetical protein KAX49_03960 [Halanaerobiales bacterium]|nr:hypothetical protein [Halanaerobiales bacterium]